MTEKGQSELADGRKVPEYVEQLPLPIRTHRPAKYAVVDLMTGQVWIASHDDPSKPVGASKEDRQLIKKLVR